ncbi:DUF1674 domain-containing protein [Methylobacterium haplocladii]|uniref:DUF1674 domain-containing protein n=2 Tax=Methylobacterium haplocladii TaxID=1176176 RepID=A0A512IIR7_9HYPH|nr:DUF1674 domain-containing protein [Methylobacterium haplocladii]GEO97615.1 hypothetical protein MHA02_00030 [Methylobacterium haplocladii]GJD84510.1 hypothetical protein HPGCJGGD_2387 [Methylobacterium haplocladii]GLS61423.1 hypothetical protein GCM10007887_41320 [Methylobacterium haplocladii]
MHDDTPTTATPPERPPPEGQPSRVLTPAAQRALAEAAERRAAIDARAAEIAATRETSGRGGLEPVRYADWEVKGIAVDF